MALRALLFSSDGSATSALCHLLTDLSIEAEICSEILVAVERVSRQSYDAILVDWDQEAEATILLKAAREHKGGQALNLALMQNDKDVGRALQQGANSVIKKPVDPRQAEETLSTARDLILSRRAEQQQKDARAAAVQAEVSAAAEEFTEHETPAPKTGFLSQTARRSAFEAEAQAETHEAYGDQPVRWQAARGPDALREDLAQVQAIRPTEKKRWDQTKPLAKACRTASTPHVPSGAPGVAGQAPETSGSVKPDDPSADSGPVVTTDVDPSKIQIIETKTIPKAGAQLPATTDPPAGPDPTQAHPDTAPTNTSVVTDSSGPAAPGVQAQVPIPTQSQAQPQVPAALIPVAQPRVSIAIPAPESRSAPSEGRTGVIIPDSLKTTPSPAPASSLEALAVSEEASRDLVAHRVDPDYPAQALQQHLEVPVVLEAWVGKDGTIQDLKLVKGYFILGRAAFAAVKQWRFKPYSPNGKAIDFQTYITIYFKYPG